MAKQNILSVKDFNNILEDYAGQRVQHVPVTKTLDNLSGQETLTEGTMVYIKAYFMRTSQNWDYAKAGFIERGDAVLLSKYDDSVGKDDLIILNDVGTCRVKEVFSVPGVFGMDQTSDTEYVYNTCNLFLVR